VQPLAKALRLLQVSDFCNHEKSGANGLFVDIGTEVFLQPEGFKIRLQ
jgi:hypothetical protein